MNGNKFLADTNTLIYLYDGNQTVAEILDGKTVFISFITEIELLSKPGLKPAQLKLLQRLLNDFVIIDINKAIKDYAALIRRQYRIKLPDAIISATAKYLSVPLITADNIFKKVPDVDIILFDI